MNIKYETQGTNTYVVYEIDKSEMMDSMTLGMITNNKIPGLAQAFFFQQDNSKYVKYNVSSKVSAEQFLMGTVNKKRLIGVFKGIVNALISAEEYMIDASSLCFDLDYIYTDVTSCETVMLCLPITDTEKPLVDLKAFFKNIVFSVQFDQMESGDYIAKLINYLNSASVFSLYDFKEVLDMIEHGAKPVVQQEPQIKQEQSQMSVSQPVVSQAVTQVQPQSVVQPVTQQQVTTRPTSVTQPAPQVQQTTMPNTAFAIPGQDVKDVASTQSDVDSATVENDEKEISWLYLLRHYDKDTAALYKVQQEAKKAAKAAGKSDKTDKKKDKKNKKDTEPTAMPNTGFAIPCQTSAPASQPSYSDERTMTPTERALFSPQQTSKQVQPQMQPVQMSTPQASPVQQSAPVSQLYQTTIMMGQPQSSMNFGETTVLNAGMGETTVLGVSSATIENNPHLIRTKNNERIMIDKPVFRIGKEKSFVDYFISDNTAISRGHANIITKDGEYFVQDLNSTNHTYVDGQMIQSNLEVKIAHGTKIKLANEDFEFRIY